MSSATDEPGSRGLARPLLGFALLLALGATAALALTDETRWLRLGIIAALWAALGGAFLAAKYRKQMAHTEETAVEAQEVYELELEREVAARREFELEMEAENRSVEAEVRAEVEAESREQLQALRAEVQALRQSLESLVGGEVLFERVALTAQSTRMRSFHDDNQVITPSLYEQPQLSAGRDAEPEPEKPTQLIERMGDSEREARRAEQPSIRRRESVITEYEITMPQPAVRAESSAPRRDRQSAERSERSEPARSQRPPNREQAPSRRRAVEAPAASRREPQQAEASRPAAAQQQAAQQPAAQQPAAQQPAQRQTAQSAQAARSALDGRTATAQSQSPERGVSQPPTPQRQATEYTVPEHPVADRSQGERLARSASEQGGRSGRRPSVGEPATHDQQPTQHQQLPQRAPRPAEREQQPAAQSSAEELRADRAEEFTLDWTPSWETGEQRRTSRNLSAAFPSAARERRAEIDEYPTWSNAFERPESTGGAADQASPIPWSFEASEPSESYERPTPPPEPVRPQPEPAQAFDWTPADSSLSESLFSRDDSPAEQSQSGWHSAQGPESRHGGRRRRESTGTDLTELAAEMHRSGRSGGRRRRADPEDELEQPLRTDNGYSTSGFSAGPPGGMHAGEPGDFGAGGRASSDMNGHAAYPPNGYAAPSAAESEPSTPSGGGGRRRRPDGVPPWEGLRNWTPEAGDGPSTSNGSHARPAEPEPEPEPEEPSGSHAAGRSVSELLAAHGSGQDAPRRRRRRED
ncbi:MAG: hypothetical protein GEU98_27475 [Pseudonocardiaceae bacterium]|nr:hypothetical protein [Pseudonocardiaceae bacterium]